jgi:hypothetical protein
VARVVRFSRSNRSDGFIQLIEEAAERSALRDQFGKTAAFDDAAGFDDDDLVHAFEGGETMGEEQERASWVSIEEGVEELALGFGVETFARFVENEDPCVCNERAGSGPLIRPLEN